MRMSNVVMLTIALVCAALAALLSRAWLTSQSVKSPSAHTPISRAIIVAARDLKPGDKLSADMLKLVPWAGDTLPKGAFLGTEALVKPGAERVVQFTITENEPVLMHKLRGRKAGLIFMLRQGMQAYTISVNNAASGAGLIGPGSHVNVILTYGDKRSEVSRQKRNPGVLTLLRNVHVLAVNQTMEQRTKTAAPKTVTLEVNSQNAQRLALASQMGQLSLSLTHSEEKNAEHARPVTWEEILPQLQQGQSAQTGTVPEDGPGTNVIIMRDVKRKVYRVPEDNADSGWQHQNLSHQN